MASIDAALIEALEADVIDASSEGDGGATTEETVLFFLATDPEDVTVTIDGTDQPDPHRIEMRRSRRPLRVIVTSPGHYHRVILVVPNRQRRRSITLRPR